MIVYRENPKYVTKKNLLGLINKFGKAARYKINIQKSVVFLHTNNEVSEREIKKIILFTIISKRTKYLGINLTKELNDLLLGNYKTLMKETEDDMHPNVYCSTIYNCQDMETA